MSVSEWFSPKFIFMYCNRFIVKCVNNSGSKNLTPSNRSNNSIEFQIDKVITMKILKVSLMALTMSMAIPTFAEELPTDPGSIISQSGVSVDSDIFPTEPADIIAQSGIPELNKDFTGIPELKGLEQEQTLHLDDLAGGKGGLLKTKKVVK